MSINRRVYAFSSLLQSTPAAPETAGRAEISSLSLILLAGLLGLGWLSAAMLVGQVLGDLIPSCC